MNREALMTIVEIPLTQGRFAKVLAEDAPRIQSMCWHAVKAGQTFYAAHRKKTHVIYMHRLILGLESAGRSVFVDHINHDGLDNTRGNLRPCTPAENNRNRRVRVLNIPPWAIEMVRGKWQAKVSVLGKSIHLGTYETEAEARAAYCAAEKVALDVASRRILCTN
jgi:hypothetical protein